MLHFPKIIQYDIVYFRGALEEFLQILVIRAIVSRQVVLFFPGIGVGDVTAVVSGDKAHATVDFHRIGIIENRHTPSYIFLGDTVMVSEQRNIRVLTHGHEFSFFHYVTFLGKRTEIVLLATQEHLLT